MAAVDLIPLIAPELAGNVMLSDAIALAESEIAADHCRRDAAVANLAAHTLTIAARGGSAGPVTSESEGSLSRSYGVDVGSGALDSTSYGKELKRLNRICYGFSARTVNHA